MSPQSAPGPNELQLLKDVERLLADPRLTPEMREELLRDAALLLDPPKPVQFVDYAQSTLTFPLHKWQERVLCPLIQRLSTEKGLRILFHAPPQYGKSVLLSQRCPAYLLGVDPLHRIGLACYNETHAGNFGAVVRDLMLTAEYAEMFPDPRCRVRKDSSAGEFSTAGRKALADGQASFVALGLLSGFTGKGVDTLLMDDPYKSAEEARSETINDKVHRFWKDTANVRVGEEANVVVMFHRYHTDDLCARLMDEGGWEYIRLPAIFDPDDTANDPTVGTDIREPDGRLSPMRSRAWLVTQELTNPSTYRGQFQGSPRDPEGGNFKSSWFRYYDFSKGVYHLYTPAGERIVRADECHRIMTVDWAATEKQENDWTVVSTWDVTPRMELLLVESQRERYQGPEAKQLFRTRHGVHKPDYSVLEMNGLGLTLTQDLIREGYPIRGVHQHRDKKARAMVAASRYEAGMIYHPREAGWLAEFEKELLDFPGPHDDQVDTVSVAASVITPGASVYSEFAPGLHQEEGDIEFDATRPLICGWAFEPALIWVATQLGRDGVWRVYCAEEGDPSQGLYAFAERIATLLREACGDLNDVQLQHGCHPDYAGFGTGKAAGGHLPWELLNKGVSAVSGYDEEGRPVHTRRTGWGWKLRGVFQSPEQREELIRTRLTTLLPGGKAALVVGPGAALVTEALLGGYEYKPLPSGGFSEKALPNKYAAVVEALGCAASLLFSAQPAKDSERTGGQGFSVARGTGRRSGM